MIKINYCKEVKAIYPKSTLVTYRRFFSNVTYINIPEQWIPKANKDEDPWKIAFLYLVKINKIKLFTLTQMLEAIDQGFEYHRDSMHDNEAVPLGNKLQWIIGKYLDPLEHESFIKTVLNKS